MRMTKKITSIVLAVLMVVSVMVVGTVAASAADVTVKTYEQFKEAVANYSAYDTIKLGADIEGTDQITFAGGTVYLDLNGYTLTNNAASPAKGDFVLDMPASYNSLYVKGTGTLQLNNWYYGFKGVKGGLNIGENVTVNSPEGNMLYTGNWTVNGTMTSDNWFTIGTNGSTSHDYAITVNEGAVLTATLATAIYHCQDGELEINGGTITGYESGVYIKAGTTEINGGTIKCTGPAADYRFNGNGTYETGDALVVDNCDYPAGTPAITITGGTFESANAKAIASYIKADDPSTGAAQQPRVEEFVKGADLKGAEAVDNDIFVAGTTVETVNGVTTVRNYICEDADTGVKYESIDEALQAAGEGGTVKLIKDIAVDGDTGNVGISIKHNGTFDLNGHTITGTKCSAVTIYSTSVSGKTLTFKDSVGTGGITTTCKYTGDACISDSSSGSVIIESGTYTADKRALYCSSADGWTINGGTFNGDIILPQNDSKLTITGGTVNGEVKEYNPFNTVDAEINISGGTFSSDVSSYIDTTTNDVVDNGDGTNTVIPKAGSICEVGGKGYDNLNAAVAEAMSSGNAIYLLKDLTSAEKSAYVKPSEEGTFVVYANGFTGYNFAADSKASTTPYVISWTIKGNSKANYIYTYTIKAATIQVTRANGDVVYPTSLYTALAGTKSSGCAQEGETVKLLADMDFDADKAAIKVSKTNVTLDLNGNDFTAVRENFLEVGNGKTLTVENGTIGGTGNVKVGEGSTLALDNATVEADLAAGADAKLTFANGATVTNVETPEGYEVQDNGNGSATVVYAPLNPLEKAAADIDDGNLFGINCDYLAGTLLGVQKKTVAGEETSSQEGEKNMRFIAVLDTDLIQAMQVADDYGFVLAKANNTNKTYADINYDAVKAGDDRVKTISAKGTSNNVCGTGDYSAYGDPSNTTTDYKYITCAVNNVTNDDKVIARFYYKKDGKTYYAKYAGHNYQYTGCMAAWSDLA